MEPEVPPAPSFLPPAPQAPEPRRGWPTGALVAIVGLALVAILGVVGGQLQARSAKDDLASARERLAAVEDDADDELDELQQQLEEATVANEQLTAAADTAAADLVTAQATVEDQATRISELEAQVEASATTVPSPTDGLFPVGLEDLAKVDLSFAGMALTSQIGECTYATETCDYLRGAALEADMYQDGGQWILTMRADGAAYFQAALVLDETGSFSGSEFINAEGTCDGQPSSPFATVYVNPVEFDAQDGTLRGTAFRGYLSDSTDCGRSTFTFQGRVG